MTCHNRADARALGGERPRCQEPLLRHVPQHPQLQVRAGAAQNTHADGPLRDVPSRQGGQAGSLGAHAGPRRQDGMLDLPQPARIHERQAAAEGGLDRRAVHVLPRRQARTFPVGARADPGRLRHLPRPPRLVERADARRETADFLPALPRFDAPSEHDLRRSRHRFRCRAEHSHLRPVVRDLSLEYSRVQPSERPAVPSLRSGHHEHLTHADTCSSSGSRPPQRWPRPRLRRPNLRQSRRQAPAAEPDVSSGPVMWAGTLDFGDPRDID